MPSLKGYLDDLRWRALTVTRSLYPLGSVKAFLWLLLSSIPRTILSKQMHLRSLVEHVKDQLCADLFIQVNGIKFRCVDSESLKILSPTYESQVWRHLNLERGDVFIDVGAHVGKYTLKASKVVGEGGLVVAIEPHPKNYRYLLENIKLNGLKNVVALNLAAWSDRCKVKLFVSEKAGQHSVKKDSKRGYIYIQADTLDNILGKLNVEKVDAMKIDVEGAEVEVLKGALSTLIKHHPRIVIEAWDVKGIKQLADKIGYKMKQIEQDHYLLGGCF